MRAAVATSLETRQSETGVCLGGNPAAVDDKPDDHVAPERLRSVY